MTSHARLRCTSCGTTTDAPCACGVAYAYVPAGKRAEEALAENPQLSDRAIAEEIGVSDRTVNRARKSTATNVAVEKRIGKDGKQRKMPEAKTVETGDPEPSAQTMLLRMQLDGLQAALSDPKADITGAIDWVRPATVRKIIIMLQAALAEHAVKNKGAVEGTVLQFRQGGADEHPL